MNRPRVVTAHLTADQHLIDATGRREMCMAMDFTCPQTATAQLQMRVFGLDLDIINLCQAHAMDASADLGVVLSGQETCGV